MCTAAILEDRNKRMIFLWGINVIFMQISLIVLVLQHGRRAHTLYSVLTIYSHCDVLTFFLLFFFFMCKTFHSVQTNCRIGVMNVMFRQIKVKSLLENCASIFIYFCSRILFCINQANKICSLFSSHFLACEIK